MSRSKQYESVARYAPGAKNWPFAFPLPHQVSDIVFFDLETTVPQKKGDTQRVIEFGAIVVDGATLHIKHRVSQLIYNENISARSTAINHISRDEAARYGTFGMYADMIHKVLDNRVWAGHNIIKFDIHKLVHEFELISRPMPTCVGVIDTYSVFAAWEFERNRLNTLKLDDIGRWFGMGNEAHRAVQDAERSFHVLLMASASSCFNALVNKIPDTSSVLGQFDINHADRQQSLPISVTTTDTPMVITQPPIAETVDTHQLNLLTRTTRCVNSPTPPKCPMGACENPDNIAHIFKNKLCPLAHIGYKKSDNLYCTYLVHVYNFDGVHIEGANKFSINPLTGLKLFRLSNILWVEAGDNLS